MMNNRTNKKSYSWDYIVALVTKWAFIGAFAIGVLYLIYYCLTDSREMDIPENVEYMNEWSYRIDGQDWQNITLPCNVEVEDGVTVEYKATLPNNLNDNMWLATLNSRDLIVSVDGKNRYSWERDKADFPGGPVKSVYMFVPINQEDAGKTIILIKHGRLNNGTVKKVLIGDSFSVMNELHRSMGKFRFNAAILLFILAIILLSVSVTLKILYQQEIPLILLSMGAMTTSAWLVMDSNLFQIVFGIRYIDGFLSYILTLIMLFPYMLYVDEIQNHRYRNIYAVLSIVQLMNFAICTALHLCGIVNFTRMLAPLDFIIAWLVVIIIVCIVIDVFVHRERDYVIVAIGILVFGLMSVAEIITINTTDLGNVEGVFMLVGIFALMIMAATQQIKDIAMIEWRKREAAEENLAQQKFLTNMSHEIRTPINTILGMNEMILCENSSEDVRKYAERISHSGQLLLSLINDVLDFSLYKAGEEKIVSEEYDIRSLVDDVLDVLKIQTSEKGLGCNVGLSADIPSRLMGDPKLIMRILNNIVSNAVKYTDNGSITFSFECEEQEGGYNLEFVISDTGRGIRQEDFDKIFDPFVRSDIRKNRSIDGTGLGLAITKEIVEKMGGTIAVESTLGHGSTFTVKIPQGAVDGAEKITVDYCSKLSRQSKNDNVEAITKESNEDLKKEKCACTSYEAKDAKVLAVDDNNSNLIVIREFLKSTKVQLEVVNGGQEAIDKCNEVLYDIILMDHMMPDPDGVAAMHAIKEGISSLNRTTPIIVLTANAVGDCKEQYLKEGFNDYLSKPVSRPNLLETIRKFINPKLIVESGKKKDEPLAVIENQSVTDESTASAKESENAIIDFDALNNRFDNIESAVDMVLSECVKEGEKKIILLRQLYEDKDIARYAVEAHGVKGVMASICADKISQRAKKHEFAAKENRVSFIDEDIDGFIDEYREVLDYIAEYLTKKGIEVKKPKPVIEASEGDTLENLKAQIEEALDEFDADKALNYIDKLRSIVGEDKESIINEIRDFADDFQYDLAKESLEKL